MPGGHFEQQNHQLKKCGEYGSKCILRVRAEIRRQTMALPSSTQLRVWFQATQVFHLLAHDCKCLCKCCVYFQIKNKLVNSKIWNP